MYHDNDNDPRPKYRKFPLVTPAAMPPLSGIAAHYQQTKDTGPITYAPLGEFSLLFLALLLILFALYNRSGGFFFSRRSI